MEQKCALEKQILQNALSFSSTAPDEMAFPIMKTPGYTAVTAGEVIHLIKCIPVECRARQTSECHNELRYISKSNLFPHAEIQNHNQIGYPERLQRATTNHVQDPRLLVPINA
jgi:hypothetical protein